MRKRLVVVMTLLGCGSSAALVGAIDSGVDARAPDAAVEDIAAPPADARRPWDAGACGAGVGSWPMVAHDPQRTGRSDGNGPRTDHIRWRYPTTNYGSSPAVAADGTVYMTAEGGPGTLLALHPDGTLVWSVPGVGPYASPMIGADGTIYVEGDAVYDPSLFKFVADILIAVDPKGTRKWTYSDFAGTNTADNSPVPGPDDVIFVSRQAVYGVRTDGAVNFHLGKDRGSGKLNGNGDFGGRRIAISSGLAIAGIGNLDSAEAGTFAVASDGATAWKLDGMREGLIGADGIFYSVGATGVDAISAAGALLWHLDLEARTLLVEGPTGTLFLRTRDGVVGINPKSPTVQLVYPIPDTGQQSVTSLVIDAAGYIYFYFVDATGPKVFVLEPSGGLAFTIDLSNKDGAPADYVDATSLALGDCVLYIAAFQNLIAVGL